MHDVGLDGAERFVPDHSEDLLLLLQADEVTKPRLLGQPAGGDSVPFVTEKKKQNKKGCC